MAMCSIFWPNWKQQRARQLFSWHLILAKEEGAWYLALTKEVAENPTCSPQDLEFSADDPQYVNFVLFEREGGGGVGGR